MKSKKLWVVGKYCGEIKSGEGDFNIAWQLEGIYSNKRKAISRCIDQHYFTGSIMLDKGTGASTVEWTDCYYPKGN